MISRLVHRLRSTPRRQRPSRETRVPATADAEASPPRGADSDDLVSKLAAPASRIFTDRDGLPQRTILDMDFDSRGYLWVGTEDGAARYNGRTWQSVAMPNRTRSNYVKVVRAARDGGIWFGTYGGGLVRYHDGKWTVYDTASGLPDDLIIAVLEGRSPDGKPAVWVGTRSGLGCLAGGRWSVYRSDGALPNDVVMCLAETEADDGSPVLWAGTRGGLARHNRGRWTQFTAESGLPDDSLTALHAERAARGETRLWVGTAEGDLARFDGSAWTTFDTSCGRPKNRVFAVIESADARGRPNLLLGTQAGLIRFDDGACTPLFGDVWGLPPNNVFCLRETPARLGPRALWIGTDGSGVVTVGPSAWLSMTSRTVLPESIVMAFGEAPVGEPERFWIGTDNGLLRIDAQGAATLGVAEGVPGRFVRAIVEVPGPGATTDLLVGTHLGGLGRLHDGEWSVLDSDHGFFSSAVNCILVEAGADGEEVLWLGTDAGVARLEGEKREYHTVETGLPHHFVFCLARTGDASGEPVLWAGTNGGGLARLDRRGWSVLNGAAGFPNDVVLGLREVTASDGTRELWAGTQGAGVVRVDLDADPPRWRVLSDETRPALPNNTINGIEVDRRGRIYLFTNRGVVRLTPRTPTADDAAEFSIYTYTTDDGLPSNETNTGASFVDRRGRVWAGTVAGAAVLDPASEVADRTPKPLYISSTIVDGERVALSPDAPLRHDRNNLAFEFDLLSYFRESDTRYRTQLVGFDARPSGWQVEAKCSYTNLPAGRYTFTVWGRDYAGNVSGPARVSFRISPAPWKRWWAYAGYAGLAAGAVYGGVQYRIHALRRRTAYLEEQVRQQTAELADNLERLTLSESVAREKAAELARAVEQLRTLERNAQAARLEAVAAKDRAVEASQAKSAFLSSMSHELRTPLNAVLGFAQLLERDVTLLPEQREHLAAITTSGEHLLHLINDVLSLSKIEAGRLTLNAQRFDLHRLLEGVEMMLRGRTRAKGLRLRVERAKSLPRFVVGDEGKLRQVLINLLGNAVKFTESGQVTLRIAWRDGIGEFEIEDTGQGIAPDELEALFEPFVQTESGRRSKEGTGLGLAISRNFVRMMGGDVGVTSETGRGSTFRFDVELPLAAGDEDADGRPIVAELEPNQPEFRILVVDDVERNRLLLVKLLSSVGFTVAEASDGREAIAVWASWRPDLILLDIRMPGLDGKAAAREIRAWEGERALDDGAPPVRIVALTASAFEHERQEILASGCDTFMTKPFREEHLFALLQEHLGVRFRYLGQERPPSGAHPAAAGDEVGAERIQRLPRELVAGLADAVVKGDVEQANRIVDAAEPHDPDLAAALRALIRSYRFDEIQDWIERSRV